MQAWLRTFSSPLRAYERPSGARSGQFEREYGIHGMLQAMASASFRNPFMNHLVDRSILTPSLKVGLVGLQACSRIMSVARSPIMIAGALVLPPTTVGMIEASATRRQSMPLTRRRASTTAIGSLFGPILQVPTGWY